MVRYREYVAGWLDSSIRDFLAALPRDRSGESYALITCLDSNSDPASLLKKSPDLRAALAGAKPLKKGLLLPSTDLQKASLRAELFCGFDEVWFFPSDNIEPKPESASIVGPYRIDQAKLDKLGRWMSDNACSLALGDGDGLNVLVRAEGVVKHFIAHSLCQPEPSAQMNELWVQDEE